MIAQNKRFLADLKNWRKSKEEQVSNIIAKTVEGLVDHIVYNTPHGDPDGTNYGNAWSPLVYEKRVIQGNYKPGRFKSSWNVSLDSVPDIGSNNAVDITGEPSLANARAALTGFSWKTESIAIVNTAENPETGEYYPLILMNQEETKFLGYENNLNMFLPPLTYEWATQVQDHQILPTVVQFNGILRDAVESI